MKSIKDKFLGYFLINGSLNFHVILRGTNQLIYISYLCTKPPKFGLNKNTINLTDKMMKIKVSKAKS